MQCVLMPIVGYSGGSLASVFTWTPATLGSSVVAWYSADSGVYKDAGSTIAVDGDTVQQWNDRSGNGNNLTQATAGARPTFNTTTFNGLRGITFAAGSSTALSSAANAINIGVTTASCFAVLKITASGTFGVVSLLGNGQTTDFGNVASSIFVEELVTNPNLQTIANLNNIPGPLASFVVGIGGFYRFGSIYDGTNGNAYSNNVFLPTAVATATNFTTGTLCIGASQQSPNTAFFTGILAEVVLTKTALSSADRLNLDTYFRMKWNL